MKTSKAILTAGLVFAAGTLGFAEDANLFMAAEGTPAIDGAIEGWWDSYSWVAVQKTVQGQTEEQGDFSASYKAAYTDSSLYLLVKVVDSEINTASGPNYYFDADSVSLFFDFNDDKSSIPGRDDMQLSLVYGKDGIHSREGLSTQALQKAWSAIPGGYVLEMRIPFSALGQDGLSEGDKLGFDILVNDVGLSGEHKSLLSWSGDDSDFSSSTALGQLYVCVHDFVAVLDAQSAVYQDLAPGSLQGIDFLETSNGQTGKATFRFDGLEPGLYYAWMKVQAPDTAAGRFSVSVDEEWDTSKSVDVSFAHSEDFRWVRVSSPVLKVDSQGNHSLYAFGTSRFAKLSKVLLTNNAKMQVKGLERPSINSVAVRAGVVQIGWNALADQAQSVAIERRDNGVGNFAEIARVNGQLSPYADRSAMPNDGLEYRIRSVGEADGSAYSAVQSLVYRLPGAPDDVRLEVLDGKYRLSWNNVSAISGYSIEMRQDDQPYAEVAKVRPDRQQWADVQRAHLGSASLSYRMRAYNAAGYSPYAYPAMSDDVVSEVRYSDGNSDVFIVKTMALDAPSEGRHLPKFHDTERSQSDAIFQDLNPKDDRNEFLSLPSYLIGTSYLRAFYKAAGSEEREYVSFLANKSVKLYLVVSHDAEVDRDRWVLRESRVVINQFYYPDGVDIYTQSVVKGTRTVLPGNRNLTRNGNQFLLFFEEDPTASISINFGPSDTPKVEGYELDTGAVYGTKPSGLCYGWLSSARSYAKLRSKEDPLSDSFIEIPRGNNWKISLPDGQYRVDLALGDESGYTPEEVRINGKSYFFDEDRRVVGNDKRHLLIEDVFIISGRNQNVLQIENGNSSAKLDYLQLTRVDQHVSRVLPVGDTYIRGGRNGRNAYGHEDYISVKELDGSEDQQSVGVLQFSVPMYKDPISATLSVYVRDMDPGHKDHQSIQLYALENYTFSEGTLSWESSKLVYEQKRRVCLTDKAKLVGQVEVAEENQVCRFDVTDFLQSRKSRDITFLLVSPAGSNSDFVLYAREKGTNSPAVEVVSEKQGIAEDGYLSSPESGRYMLHSVELVQYSLISGHVDLSAFKDANVSVSGYLDPDWLAATGQATQIVVQQIKVIAPPGKPDLGVPSWDNTGFPLWKWSVSEGVTLFRCRLDNGYWQETTQNSYVPRSELSEGIHTLDVECKNRLSDWSEPVGASVKVDLSRPWITRMTYKSPTNNQTPTFSWTAQDNFTVAAELLYQYTVDGRDWISSIQNSYTVSPSITEGMHGLQVQVRDLAGNWSNSSFTIEIDLTPPEEATKARVYYNDGSARLVWSDSVSKDVDYYVVTRNPPFSSSVRVAPGVQQFLDESAHVGSADVFTYKIQAVDKATNVSLGTSASGGVVQTVTSDSQETQVVSAEQVKVSFAPGTVEHRIDVVIKEVDAPAVAQAGGRQMGPVYHFEPEGTEFLAPVMIYFHYDKAALEEPSDETNLCVSYYDAVRSRWVRIPSVVDRASGDVVGFTTHFSEYALRVDSTDAYEGEGINPFGEYFSNNNEHISEGDGGLFVTMPLASIPGVRGNDLQLNLMYSSSDAVAEAQSQVARTYAKVKKLLYENYGNPTDKILTTEAPYLPPKQLYLGAGWSLDMPQIVNSTLYLPGGAAYSLFLGQEVHSGVHFKSERVDNTIKVTLSNGYVYYFDGSSYFALHTAEGDTKGTDWVADYYTKLKEYSTGNTISMNDLQKAYSKAFNSWTQTSSDWDSQETNRVAQLSQVTDPFGNTTTYTFSVSPGNVRLTVSCASDSITYDLSTGTVRCNNVEKAKIVFQAGRIAQIGQAKNDGVYLSTKFEYSDSTLDYKIDYSLPTDVTQKLFKDRTCPTTLLSKISYPSGAWTQYVGTLDSSKDRQWRYRYTSQKAYDKAKTLQKDASFTFAGGFQQIGASLMSLKDAIGNVVQEQRKYYGIFGNMCKESEDGREVTYDYYYEPAAVDRLQFVFREGGLSFSDVTFPGGDNNTFSRNGMTVSECPGILGTGLKIALPGGQDLYLLVSLKDYSPCLLISHGAATLEAGILTVAGDEMSDPSGGYITKDPLRKLLDYKGNAIYLLMRGANSFELIYTNLQDTEKGKRNRIKTKSVKDSDLTYQESYDYDTNGNTIYEAHGDGHQVWRTYHGTHHDQQTLLVESRNEDASYQSSDEALSAGNCNQTTWTYNDTLWAPLIMSVYDGSSHRDTTYEYNTNGTTSRITKPGSMVTDFTYNDKGLLLSRTARGASIAGMAYSADVVTTYTYDALNHLQTESVGNRTTTYAYDGLGRVTQITYPDGSRKIQYYDDSESTTTIANVKPEVGDTIAGLVPEIASKGLNPAASSKLVNKVKYYYNGLTNLIKIERFMHGLLTPYYSVSFTYTARGLQSSTLDSGARSTAREYDPRGRLTHLILEDAGEVKIDYYDGRLVTEYTDEDGYVTSLQNDILGRLVKIWIQKDLSSGICYGTAYAYDGVGNRINVTNGATFGLSGDETSVSGEGEGEVESFSTTYNGFMEATENTDPSRLVIDPRNGADLGLKAIETQHNNLLNGGTKITEALSPNDVIAGGPNPARSWVDAQDRVLKTQSAMGFVATSRYNANGELVQSTDAAGHSQHRTYTLRGLVEYQWDDEGNATYFQYDILGKVTHKGYGTYTAGSFTERYSESSRYDSLSRLVAQSFPDGTSISHQYDIWGNVTTKTDRGGRATVSEYDARNRLTSVTAPSGVKSTYRYDKRGNKTEEIDATGAKNTYRYNGLGQLVEYQSAAGMKVAFAYDRVGRKITRTEGTSGGMSHNTTTWTYLPGTQLATGVSISDGGQSQLLQSLGYDANGNLCVANRNGVVRCSRYDADNRLFEEKDSADPAVSIGYSYYDNGLLKKKSERSGKATENVYDNANRLEWTYAYGAAQSDPAATVHYLYDFMGRVIEVVRSGEDPYVQSYEYDLSNGNLSQESITGAGRSYSTGYQYNPGGELASVLYPNSSTLIGYGYDAYGRLSGVAGATEAHGFDYNELDLAKTLTYAGGAQVGFQYDAAHRLTGVAYGPTRASQPVWALSNLIDPYGNTTGQTENGTFITQRFGQDERAVGYRYDFRNRLTGYTTGYSQSYQLSGESLATTAISRDFYLEDDRDAAFYAGLPKSAEPKPGMDYLDNGTLSMIQYYPEILCSGDAQTRSAHFALDSEGRSLILDLGTTIEGIQSVKLYPSLYMQDGSGVKERDLAAVLARFNEYNLVVKVLHNGVYQTIPSATAAGSGFNGTTWHLVPDTKRGVLEIRFSSAVSTDKLKLYVLIDDRAPMIRTDAPEVGGIVNNPVARDNPGYFSTSDGEFINAAAFIAEVVYELGSTQAVDFTYDANGNRVSKSTQYVSDSQFDQRDVSYQCYPGTNRLKSDGEYGYEYDADGNLTRRYNDYVEYDYIWNAQNRLVKVELKQYRRGWKEEWESLLSQADLEKLLVIFEAKYDESGRRYWKWARQTDDSFSETRYVYTSVGLLYEETTAGSTTTAKSYVYAGGKKLAEVTGSLDVACSRDINGQATSFLSDRIRYTVTDQIGSTRLMVDAAGSVAWYGEYEPFGATSFEESVTAGAGTNQTFTSYTRDVEIGLQYAQARYYDSGLGRFISEDPAQDGENWFAYAENNPVKYADPSGLNVINEGGSATKEADSSASSGSGSGSGQDNTAPSDPPTPPQPPGTQPPSAPQAPTPRATPPSDQATATTQNSMPAQAVFGPQGELLTVYPRDVTSEERLRIIQAAETYLGVPYEWGGSSREGIDCSHLVSVSIKEAGIPYSYSTTGTMSQNTSLRSIAQSEAGIGDVILFVGHTGIYNPDTPVAGKPVISAQTKLPAAVSYGKVESFAGPHSYYRVQILVTPW